MLAKAVFAQTHRHLYFFDLCGQQKSIRSLQKTNDKSVISEFQSGLAFCVCINGGVLSKFAVGCRSPP